MAARRKPTAVLCSRCRQLISVKETKCPYCGAVQPALWGFAPGLRKLFADKLDLVGIIFTTCVGLYLVSLAVDPQAVMQAKGLWNIGSPASRALYLLGMTGGAAWGCGYWWTLLSASFLHGSLIHIAFNLMWVRDLGPVAVKLLGPARFFVVYMISGAVGFLVSNLMTGAPTIGASASIFGLLGLLAGFGKRRGGAMGAHLSFQMFRWGAIIFVLGFMMGGINNWAHGGGFLAGFGMAWLLPKHENQHESRGVQILALVLLVATAAAVGLSAWKFGAAWDLASLGLPPCAADFHHFRGW